MGILFSATVYAQKNRRVCFVNNQGTPTRDASEFIRIVEEPSNQDEAYTVYEYYSNGALKQKGQAKSLDPTPVFNGPVTTFYPNGSRKDIIFYKDGQACDSAYFYHPNGKLKKVIFIACEDNGTFDPLLNEHTTIKFFDKNGNQTVKNGNGYCYSEDSITQFSEEGNYANGQKEGEWNVSRQGHKAILRYKNGKFIDGEAHWSDGTKHAITALQTDVKFNGANELLKKEIADRLHCPTLKDVRMPESTSVTFVVNQNGKVGKIKFGNALEYRAEDLVISALKDTHCWIPATRNGIPVPSEYSMSLSLR